MPTLGVCGDSFMAATLNGDREDLKDSEGRHFTEILAKKIGYDYFTLARGACSNTAIRLQVDEMIKQKVDLVIIGTTSYDRLEIPHIGKKYNPELGVYNLDYRIEFYPDRSSLNPKFKHNLMTDTLTNIFHDPVPFIKKIFNSVFKHSVPNLTQEQLNALELYYDYLYEPSYKSVLDSYIILSAIKALEVNSIPFILIWNGSHCDNINFSGDNRIIMGKNLLRPGNWGTGHRRWHTTDIAQEKGAELWYNYLMKNGFLKN